MLKNTFIHIPGVGFKTEKKIWEKDIFSWDDFFKKFKSIGFTKEMNSRITQYLNLSNDALTGVDIKFFAETMPKFQMWRLYKEFEYNTVFLDIETTGLSLLNDDITIIGLFDGKDTKIFIKDQNFHNFMEKIQEYLLLVTYNGSNFDIPFIWKTFKSIALPPVHIDLRYLLRRVGYSGGLKAIEKKVGIPRNWEVENVDGFEATLLWREYLKGNLKALELLIKYNIEDIKNLKKLLEFGYNKMVCQSGFPGRLYDK
ncbi:MAG: ribonuclease H-like domain-containing protein [Thermodesulfobacteriota bacterium]|nr:ribonuclease H-like domain-containing protein [Thermodesulfobacteriota bacterium]